MLRLKTKHSQRLIQRVLEPLLSEVVGAHEPVTSITEHPQASSSRKGRIHAGDAILLRQKTDVIRALKEHLDKIGTSSSAPLQEGFKETPPLIRKSVRQEKS